MSVFVDTIAWLGPNIAIYTYRCRVLDDPSRMLKCKEWGMGGKNIRPNPNTRWKVCGKGIPQLPTPLKFGWGVGGGGWRRSRLQIMGYAMKVVRYSKFARRDSYKTTLLRLLSGMFIETYIATVRQTNKYDIHTVMMSSSFVDLTGAILQKHSPQIKPTEVTDRPWDPNVYICVCVCVWRGEQVRSWSTVVKLQSTIDVIQ